MNLFNSVILLFVVHPFDVGDALLITTTTTGSGAAEYCVVEELSLVVTDPPTPSPSQPPFLSLQSAGITSPILLTHSVAFYMHLATEQVLCCTAASLDCLSVSPLSLGLPLGCKNDVKACLGKRSQGKCSLSVAAGSIHLHRHIRLLLGIAEYSDATMGRHTHLVPKSETGGHAVAQYVSL